MKTKVKNLIELYKYISKKRDYRGVRDPLKESDYSNLKKNLLNTELDIDISKLDIYHSEEKGRELEGQKINLVRESMSNNPIEFFEEILTTNI